MQSQDPQQSFNPNQPPIQPVVPPQPQVQAGFPVQPQQPYATPMAPISTGRPGPNIKLIAIIAVVAVLLIGGGIFAFKALGGGSDSNASLLAEPKTVSKDTKVNQAVDLDGLKLTVSAVDQRTKLGEYDEPQVGHVYIIATVRVENKTDHNVTVTPYDFKYATTGGQLLNGTDVYDSSEKLPNGEIAPGGTAQGLIKFEVPTAQIGDGVKITFETKHFPDDYTKPEITYKTNVAL